MATEIRINSLEDLGPIIAEHVAPLVKESVQACTRAFLEDPFNDNWTFGTQLWKNLSNRIKETALMEDTPLEIPIKGNEYFFSIGNANIYHHRVDEKTLLPNSAKAVKELVDELQLTLFPEELKTTFKNIILGISATPYYGLKEIFVGRLEKEFNSEQYRWAEKITLFNETYERSNIPIFAEAEPDIETIPILLAVEEEVEDVQVFEDESGRFEEDEGRS